MLIGPNCVVSINYELTNDAGEILDASPAGEPLVYLHGAHNIIPGLENGLLGKAIGAEFNVSVQPQDGYGVHQADLIQQVPLDAFPDPTSIAAGMRFTAQSDNGNVSVVVTSVTQDSATVDANHPLAGVVLHFKGSVAAVREATHEELSHGHSHSGDGHHH